MMYEFKRFRETVSLGRLTGDELEERLDAIEDGFVERYVNGLAMKGWEPIQINTARHSCYPGGEVTTFTPLDYSVGIAVWARRLVG